ncbi:MAG TPA: redoxin domain-containing protein [Candidatus Eisenbacteria bacterium]
MPRRFIALVGLVVAALTGLYLGMSVRSSHEVVEESAPPTTELVTGAAFPDVDLVSEDGSSTSSRTMLGGEGGVVLFLLPGRAPCKDMSTEWQRRLDDGELADVHFYAVANAPADRIALYKGNNHYSFPIVADTAGVFGREHRVEDFPLLIVVDRNHVIRHQTWDPAELVEMAAVRRMIAGE